MKISSVLIALALLGATSSLIAAPPAKPPAKPAGLVIEGKIAASTKPPRPRSVPYKDAIIALHLTNIKATSGKIADKEIVVFVWGMRDNKWTDYASLAKGKTVKLKLTPWDKAERKYGSYNRFELEGKKYWKLTTFWAEKP